MKPLLKKSLWLSVAFLLVAGCGRSETKTVGHALPEPPRIAGGEIGKPGGKLTLAIVGSPRTFNPLIALDNASDSVTRLLFSPLVVLDMVTQEPTPGLAESWSVAADQKTWTFKLRKNLRWSDGEPLTADDVVFTWNDVMNNPQYNQLTYGLFHINGKGFEVTKVDDTTVRVVTPEVFAPFLEYFGTVMILPKHILEAPAKAGLFLRVYGTNTPLAQVVGSGPFCLKEFEPGRFVRLGRNPEYWVVDKQNHRLPYLDEVELTVAPGNDAANHLFLDGKTDALETIPRNDWWIFVRAADTTKRFKVVELGVGVERDFFWFNENTGADAAGKPFVNPVKLKWFRNEKFRQAVSCSINRERIAHEVYADRAQPVYGFISAENKKWNNPKIPIFSYDVDRARALFAEAGMKTDNNGVLHDADGNAVEISLLSSYENPTRGRTAKMIEEDLKKVGVQVSYQPADFRSFLESVNVSFNYESALMGLGGGGTDPASQVNVLKSSEPLHQWFPSQKTPSTKWEARLDSLMDAQMQTLNFTERKKYFDEAQAIWAEQLPMLCLVAPFSSAAVRPQIGNLRPASAAGYHLTWNIEELFLKP